MKPGLYETLERIAATINERKGGDPSKSYVAQLFAKGEESGHVQNVRELRLDCDADTVLLKVEQVGGIACHTGRESCFYRKLENGSWVTTDPVLKDPAAIYKK